MPEAVINSARPLGDARVENVFSALHLVAVSGLLTPSQRVTLSLVCKAVREDVMQRDGFLGKKHNVFRIPEYWMLDQAKEELMEPKVRYDTTRVEIESRMLQHFMLKDVFQKLHVTQMKLNEIYLPWVFADQASRFDEVEENLKFG